MAEYRDFTFNQGIYGRAAEYTDSSAIILAIRNILLTRPGNFPFNPKFGMNVEKYQFDLLDDVKIGEIRSELERQIARYLPSFQNVVVDVRRLDSLDGVSADAGGMIGITVSAKISSTATTTTFLLYRKNGTLNIVNETR
jgi:phage baseplate assembly protein W